MTTLRTLFEDPGRASFLKLPPKLSALYGRLYFERRRGGPLVLGNFVSTLDGVVSLESGKSGGGPISGYSRQDLMVMGLLRCVADAVMEGAGTLRASPASLLTPEHICPGLGKPYAELRRSLGMPGLPLSVIVSESGDLDFKLRVFSSSEVEALILTSAQGAKKLAKKKLPPRVRYKKVRSAGKRGLDPVDLVRSVGLRPGQILLAEGGPRLLGSLLKGRQLNELFLTLAPQVAGRDGASKRPGFVSGQAFAPEDPRWAKLISVKKGKSQLFLRYAFS